MRVDAAVRAGVEESFFVCVAIGRAARAGASGAGHGYVHRSRPRWRERGDRARRVHGYDERGRRAEVNCGGAGEVAPADANRGAARFGPARGAHAGDRWDWWWWRWRRFAPRRAR